MSLTAVELCAGAGGQALGLKHAGFRHLVLIDNDKHACATLRQNFADTIVEKADITTWTPKPEHLGCDLLAAGLTCPSFSRAEPRGSAYARDLFQAFVGHVRAMGPKAFMVETAVGFMSRKTRPFRRGAIRQLESLGYCVQVRVFDAAAFGLAQRRDCVVIVGVRHADAKQFRLPLPPRKYQTVGEALHDLMAAHQWEGAAPWAQKSSRAGPTIVGGSKLNWGAYLGPPSTRHEWADLGVDGGSIAVYAPTQNFSGMPSLTLDMVKRVQGLPDHWRLCGGKTSSYRQIANAFPPVIAEAVGREIAKALEKGERRMQ